MKKKEKVKHKRIKNVKIDMAKLEDAVVDGKFVVKLGERVAVKRIRNEKPQVSSCIFKGVEKNGDVTMWDENVTQFFSFNLSDKEVSVKIFNDS